MSIFAGLTAKVKLAGIVALSSYLVLNAKFSELVPNPQLNLQTPVLMAHGDADPIVNFQLGKMSFNVLEKMGYNVTMKVYP